jgi:hypothetical protein
MAELTSGRWLAMIISVNAVTVLSGAVLTSFVGVNGLIRRITLDRILPQFFLKENKRRSSYRIMNAFFLLCVSVLLVTSGEDFEVLDRAYTEIAMEYVPIVGKFGPELIDDLSRKWKIPKNFMFISSPTEKFTYKVEELGGVRLIL